ncbi:hypothetical protein LMG919_21345 [Xanthomonas vesicatoria]|nr:hypothetical protein LMG919_21345 [Xanthomonas vesicatoria]
MMRADLRKRSAQRVTSHSNLRSVPGTLLLLGRIAKCTFCQGDRIIGLWVDALKHHGAICLHRVTKDFLGAPVGDDDVSAANTLIDCSLVACLWIIDVFQNLVALAANIHPLTVTRATLTDLVIDVALVRKNGVLLRGRLHGETSLATRVTENN